ncbi:MAG TPA: hypothetical protein VHY22_00020 [Chthoniobacteraceae bacterium]|jgi:tetratricopeptide (TPR) repeat protein|nr:hypothetical protein [Chthoniobacteraceae bacterium]
MGISLRLLFLAAFLYVGFVLYSDAELQAHMANPDNSKVVLLFAGAVLDAVAIALVLTVLVVPAIGDRVGSFFFNPDQKIEHDPHADAISKLAQGDPEGAIEDYENILRKDPADTLALSEIARICCRDLGDTARAAIVIEHALESDWSQEQGSFLANRLVDVYLLQDDPVRARQLLVELASTMEGTKFAANALHRIHEVDRSIETGSHASSYIENSPESADEQEQAHQDPPFPPAGESEPPATA